MSATSSWELVAVTVQQPGAQRLQHPGATIRSPAIPATNQDGLRSRVDGIPDELPNTKRRSDSRVPKIAWHQPEARCSRHVQDTDFPVFLANKPKVRLDGLANGARHCAVLHLAPVGCNQGFAEPLAAVMQGQLADNGSALVDDAPDALFDCIRN